MPSVLVTGANRGIGLEFARQYAGDGWQVIAGCRDPAAAAELRALPGEIRIEALDVGDDGQIAGLGKRLGDQPIDVLINNAGVYGSSSGSDTALWLDVLRVNCIGPLHLAERLAGNVVRSKRRLIASLTSGMGSIAQNDGGGYVIYRSSKAALNMAMRSLAAELRPRKVAVVVVSPGWVRTDMGGSSAPLSPQESVAAMRRLFDDVKLADSGKFFDRDGSEIPW
jgi:NAD(P)-dependent dehydrogenase (short-subunit alcohol dehydrogenase family)